MTKNSISIVIPAYNEDKNIEKIVVNIQDFLRREFRNFEIIVVDDGSNDNTYKISSELVKQISDLRVLKNNRNYGKGYAVKNGMLSAIYDYILFIDADLSTPIEELDKCIDSLQGGTDIVIGTRASKDSIILKRQNFLREKMGKIFNLFVQLFLFRGIKDTQCGFKCFKRKAAHELFKLQRVYGFCFDAEILYIAKKRGYEIKEVPVKWTNQEESRVTLTKSPISMLLDILRIRLNNIRGCYENK